MRWFVPRSQKEKAARWLRKRKYHTPSTTQSNSQYIVFPKKEVDVVKQNTMKIVRIPCFFPPSFKASQEKVERFLAPGNIRQRFPVMQKRFPSDFIQVWVRPHKDQKYEYIVSIKPKKKIPIDFSVIHESNCLVEFIRNGSEIQSNLYVQVKL